MYWIRFLPWFCFLFHSWSLCFSLSVLHYTTVEGLVGAGNSNSLCWSIHTEECMPNKLFPKGICLWFLKVLEISGKKRYLYIKLPRLSVRVCLSVSAFRIFQKRADRFPWNFSWFIGVVGRHELENIRKISTLKVQKLGKRCKLANLESQHGPQTLDCAMTLRARLRASYEPITRWPGSVARSLRCGTVSNATEASKAPRYVGPAGLRPGKR